MVLPNVPDRLEVPLPDAPYPILIGSDWLSDLVSPIADRMPDLSHAIIIHDAAVAQPWAATIQQALQDRYRTDMISVPSGEPSKCVEQLQRLWIGLLEAKTDRKSAIIAVGGGVVGDLAGMVAATFMRGIRFVQVPTTLLAQVDSSVGGKTGINLPGAKNMVGSFWQPQLVAIDIATLGTLAPREFISGLAEVAKYGVICDAEFFAWLQQNHEAIHARDAAALKHAIRTSCQAKADVVLADERETTGRRATLNYGHTFGHAIEALAGYGHFLHGEAIAIGMQMAADLARRMGRVDDAFCEQQTELFTSLQLPNTWSEADPDAMLGAMFSDKKTEHGKLRFILPTKIGHVELVDDVPEDLVRQAITACSK
ncbi:3-dehydroquinate synthase [Rosistilla ulvae]|uniref:3-dehydroquinate synthase n=1 Tax=Rosistilla ulvae TaxID=1930277 RepID=A0A517M766_9BACT|nr:3-dehydroquinate synthase [Rosistilla ulvae]QDS90722.1 3-dehydroquinate synthase [Rosistilla ulvae]